MSITASTTCSCKGKFLQYLAVFGANVAALSEGMHVGWASIALPVLTGNDFMFKITPDEGSWLISMIPAGSILGSICAQYATDKIGRKLMISAASFNLTISWLLIGFGTNKYQFFVSRFLAGIAEGFLNTAILPYSAEISDPDIRGFLGSLPNVSMVMGMLVINLFYFILGPSIAITAYIAAAISPIPLLILRFTPDSPYYYITKKNIRAAEDSLRRFKGIHEVEEDMERISLGLFEDEEKYKHEGFWLIFKKYKNCLFISLALTFVQHMSGIFAIQSYCETIFLNQQFVIPRVANVIYFLTYFLATVNALFWVDFCGRKPLLLFSIFFSGAALLTNAIYLLLRTYADLGRHDSEFIEVLSVLLYTAAYSVGLSSVPTLVVSEIFPSRVKPQAVCLVNICFSAISTGVVKLFSITSQSVGLYLPFFIFGCNCIFGFIFIIKYVPETKNKTLEDIQIELKSR